MSMPPESASSKVACAGGRDNSELVTRAEMEEAIMQLWRNVEEELLTLRTVVHSITDGVDIEALAAAATKQSLAAPTQAALTTNVTVYDAEKETHNVSACKAPGNQSVVGPLQNATPIFDSSDLVLENSTEHKSSAASDAAPKSLVTHAGVYDAVMNSSTFKLSANLWEASTFIGTPVFDFRTSLLLCCLAAANIFVQFVYIVAIEVLLVPKKALSDETVAELQGWRITVAHDVRFMDEGSGTSMASRVCGLDRSLEMSAYQVGLARSIVQFLAAQKLLDGPNMCMLAINSFLLLVFIELRQTVYLVLSLYELVSPSCTQISLHSNKVKLHSISMTRFIFLSVLALIRFLIAVSLGFVASHYLLYTISVSLLFLMAMKFAFVLNFDEIIYQALCPHFVKTMMSQVEAMPAAYHRKRCLGFDPSVVFCAIVIVTIVLLTRFTVIADVQERLEAQQSALCGGNQNFVYAVNPTEGTIEWAVTEHLHKHRQSYRWDAVSELEGMESLDSTTSQLSRKTQVSRVLALRGMAAGEEGADEALLCLDRLDDFDRADARYITAQAVLTYELGMEVTSCKNISFTVCQELERTKVRAMCPVSCGCGNLTSGLYLNNPEFGCARACFTNTRLMSNMREPECRDMTIEQLRNNSAWGNYWSWYGNYMDTPARSIAQRVALEYGCIVIPLARGVSVADFCVTNRGGALTAFCPESCGCAGRSGHSPLCPRRCRRDAQFMSNFKFNCSDAAQLSQDVKSFGKCEFTLLGNRLLTIESLEDRCCQVINRLPIEFFTRGNVSTTSLREMCCLEGCLEVLDDPFLSQLFLGLNVDTYSCYA